LISKQEIYYKIKNNNIHKKDIQDKKGVENKIEDKKKNRN